MFWPHDPRCWAQNTSRIQMSRHFDCVRFVFELLSASDPPPSASGPSPSASGPLTAPSCTVLRVPFGCVPVVVRAVLAVPPRGGSRALHTAADDGSLVTTITSRDAVPHRSGLRCCRVRMVAVIPCSGCSALWVAHATLMPVPNRVRMVIVTWKMVLVTANTLANSTVPGDSAKVGGWSRLISWSKANLRS